ncbi:Uncharacterised protein [uncultured archaeon]|nr:Uncharacterised protein [uncultured archaeon]
MICSRCKSGEPAPGLKICQNCRDYFQTWGKKREAKQKRICMNRYGKDDGCVCCGEKHISFLTIDHIEDDGYKNRDTQGRGKHLYRYLINQNFPRGFQTLCFNCQWGKRLNGGFCPHHPHRDLRIEHAS